MYSPFIRRFVVLCMMFATMDSHATGTLFRSYLSAEGFDTNPCTVTAPCRLLPAAIAATADGGEVWIMDTANYNTGAVTINQNVTILAVPGALGSLVTTSGADAIDITGGVHVTLRNLVFRYYSGTNNHYSIYANGPGANLVVENSEFSGVYGGIWANASGVIVNVLHSAFRDNSIAVSIFGVSGSPAAGVVDQCTFINANTWGILTQYATVAVSHNVVSASVNGIGVFPGSSMMLEDNVISHNTTGVAINSGSIGASAQSAGNNVFFNDATNVSGGSLASAPDM